MVYIQLERRALLALCYWSAGTDLVVLTFQLLLDCETVIFFFLVFILLFFLCQFLSYFLDVFFASRPSFTHSSLTLYSRQEGTTICFASDHSFDFSAFLAYAKVRAVLWSERLCTDWRFSVMETLAVILNCRWQVKRLKVPFNSVWKENFVFSETKKKKIGKQNRV